MKNQAIGKNIVIIGSGIGGLSAGIILLLLGYNVTVVEKNPLAGGLMRSYRRADMDCPVGVHYVGALGENEPLGRIFHFLGIRVDDLFERMGQDGVIDRYVLENFVFDFPVGIDAFEANLRAAFPRDKQAIDIIMQTLREIAGWMLNPSFLINPGGMFSNIDYFSSMGEYLKRLHISSGLRNVLAVPARTVIGIPLTECPIFFYYMVIAGYLFSSWRLKESGSKMAGVFAQRFSELGGKLILNNGAAKILLKGAQVVGLQLKSSDFLTADAVVAAIHPKVLLALMDPAAIKESYRRRLKGLQETESVVAAQVSVDAQAHCELTHNIYAMQTDEEGVMNRGEFYQLCRGNNQGRNLLSIITKSLYQEWSKWEGTNTGRRGPDYEEKKMSIAHDLLQNAARIFGKLKGAEIVDAYTPLTLRDYVNCPEGSCYGLMRSTGQLLRIASLTNIPLSGLYLAGQNAVASGILGSMLGSYDAARKIAGAERFEQALQENT